MNVLNEELARFFYLLNKHEVKYLLVGGVAVNYYGYARTTGDVDVWLEDSKVNRQNLVNALKNYGVESAELFLEHPLLAGFSEILLDNGIYIDLMSDLQFVNQSEFLESYNLCEKYELTHTIKVNVIHINTLIREKEQSKRAKDIEDTAQLKKIRNI